MRLLPLLALLIASTAVAGDDRGTTIAAARSGDGLIYRVTGFDALAFGLPGTADVRVGPSWSVRATGPATAFANVRVARRGDTLEIGHRARDSQPDPLERQLRFTITLPRLTSVALGGSGRMSVDRAHGPALKAAVGGSGELAIGDLQVGQANLSIGGSGVIAARGSVDRLEVSMGGSGMLRAPALRAHSARISTAGSGRVQAEVVGPAQVSTVGSGQIDLGPRARCTVSRLGSAAVRCG